MQSKENDMATLKNLLTGLLMGTIITAALYGPLIIDLGVN